MDLDAAASASLDPSLLMKVWLMVLTEMLYSSTSALRLSKKAWTACLEAASGTHSNKLLEHLMWDPAVIYILTTHTVPLSA